MRLFTFESEIWLPCPRAEVFPFFGDATNLEQLTPPWLKFEVLTPVPIFMQAGALIDYRLQIYGIPLRWRTRIQSWDPPFRFVDEQLRGPYRRWVHEHAFIERDGGTLCRDRVEYAVFGGWLVDRLLVRRDVARIFAYRRVQLEQRFGARPPTINSGVPFRSEP